MLLQQTDRQTNKLTDRQTDSCLLKAQVKTFDLSCIWNKSVFLHDSRTVFFEVSTLFLLSICLFLALVDGDNATTHPRMFSSVHAFMAPSTAQLVVCVCERESWAVGLTLLEIKGKVAISVFKTVSQPETSRLQSGDEIRADSVSCVCVCVLYGCSLLFHPVSKPQPHPRQSSVRFLALLLNWATK